MTIAMRAAETNHPAGQLPPEFAAIMRPELPSLIQEVRAEIRGTIPEYAALHDGPYGKVIQLIVEQALSTFVERVGEPRSSTIQRDKTFQRFGRFEAYEGRGLDTMEAAFRIGARLALHRGKKVARRYNISTTLMIVFADQLFAYVDELVDVAREGYLEAKAEMTGGQDSQRQRLLELILAGPATPRSALAELAERARWEIPDQVALIAYAPGRMPDRAALTPDMLVNFEDPQPYALCPAPIDPTRRAFMDASPDTCRAAVGLPVTLEEAAESLRWARRGLHLAEAGIIDSGPYTHCEEHLVTLWLFADPKLTDALARRQLTFLDDLTPNQRDRMVDTLRAWLDTRGNAVQMAELLHLHPQTVRYRLRNLDKAFGTQLTDPDRRFTIELVLRALQLRSRAAER
ncbi:PucR family transcriptional regulator [Streptomyces sp. A7024]|uniref:PucR family transcriptional regulator n=1 Tax=Streptomyces coryli TaxID=1128680 RepID=A0A6G4UBC7_9ACTN|nr:PucR family transcriptional regulator [Streptomyces coryli]NGN68688.1 PucR family transcriptional regulator [Streptomyces coryli]